MIISYHKGGLCNRLKSLFSAMRMGKDYRVVWPINSYIGCSFNDLFENKIEYEGIRTKFKDRIYGSWRFLVLPEDNINHPIDFMYNDTPDKIKEIYLEKIKVLKPIKYIIYNVKDFLTNFDDRTVSVSIRSWANIKHSSSRERKKTFDLNKFINAMKAMNDVSNFFITCDDNNIIKKLEQIFPNKIIYFPHRESKKKLIDRVNSIEGMQDIVVDLFLGGLNRRFIVSSISTYSEIQWWLGGCKSDIVVVDSTYTKGNNK